MDNVTTSGLHVNLMIVFTSNIIGWNVSTVQSSALGDHFFLNVDLMQLTCLMCSRDYINFPK